jgi:hypothetical protein
MALGTWLETQVAQRQSPGISSPLPEEQSLSPL